MPSPIQLLRRARPYLTPGFNSNEDDEPQDGQLDPSGGLLGRLSRALQPQEAVQPQMLERMPLQAAPQPAPVSTNSRSWDTSDTGGRPFMPDTGLTLRAPEGVATRPRVVPPEQVKPLTPLTRQMSDEPSPLGTELAAPQMLRPLPTSIEQPDRTLGVDEAETNYLNQLASQKVEDKNGWFKSGLKRLPSALLQGGLLGGAAGFAEGAMDKTWDERRARDKEFNIHAGNLKRYNEQADSQLKRKLVTSQIDENAAQAYARMHPQPKEYAPYHVNVPGEGTFESTPGTGTGRRVEGIPALPKAAQPDLIDWTLSDGRKIKISQAAAANADARRLEGTEQSRREADRIAREDAERGDKYNTEEARRQFATTEQEWKDASSYVSELNGLIADAKAKRNFIAAVKGVEESARTPEQKGKLAEYELELPELMGQINSAGEFATNNYREHIIRKPDGTYAVKARPVMPTLPKPTPLSSVGARRGRKYVPPKVSNNELQRLMQP